MRHIFKCLFLVLLLAACSENEKPEADEIFQTQSSGVVVLLNSFYYEIKLPQGTTCYFTGFDEEGDLKGFTFDREEAEKNPAMLTGTAFFVGKSGELLTNRHVASPVIDKVQARANMIKILQALSYLADLRMQQLSAQYDQLEVQKQNCYTTDFYGNYVVDYESMQTITQAQQELSNEYNELQSGKMGLSQNMDPEGITITPVCQLGIAYNDTYVTNVGDFIEKNPCVVTDVSDIENVDLALLQLKDKTTPEKAYVFSTEEKTEQKEFLDKLKELFGSKEEEKKGLQINEQLYMIGYNAGLVLANTKKGIKVQMTGGKVTQLPDGERLLYNIPTMQGSSGSPVVDEAGNLVAVNFAKLSGTDNFNFGIPLQKVKDFLKSAGVR